MTLHKFWSGKYVSSGKGGSELNVLLAINVDLERVNSRRGDGS
jgi:hypothetical protein